MTQEIYGAQDDQCADHRRTHDVVVHDAEDEHDHHDVVTNPEEVHGARKEGLCEVIRDDPHLETLDTEGGLLQVGNDAVDYHGRMRAVHGEVVMGDDAERPGEIRFYLDCGIPHRRGSCARGSCLQDLWVDFHRTQGPSQSLRSPALHGLISNLVNKAPQG